MVPQILYYDNRHTVMFINIIIIDRERSTVRTAVNHWWNDFDEEFYVRLILIEIYWYDWYPVVSTGMFNRYHQVPAMQAAVIVLKQKV